MAVQSIRGEGSDPAGVLRHGRLPRGPHTPRPGLPSQRRAQTTRNPSGTRPSGVLTEALLLLCLNLHLGEHHSLGLQLSDSTLVMPTVKLS